MGGRGACPRDYSCLAGASHGVPSPAQIVVRLIQGAIMKVWQLLHPAITMEHLGLIPLWIHNEDPDPAWKQIDKNYAHGGGWRHGTMNFKMDLSTHVLKYPGDPPLAPLAQTLLRDELILFYRHAIVAIVQKDGSFEVARID